MKTEKNKIALIVEVSREELNFINNFLQKEISTRPGLTIEVSDLLDTKKSNISELLDTKAQSELKEQLPAIKTSDLDVNVAVKQKLVPVISPPLPPRPIVVPILPAKPVNMSSVGAQVQSEPVLLSKTAESVNSLFYLNYA